MVLLRPYSEMSVVGQGNFFHIISLIINNSMIKRYKILPVVYGCETWLLTLKEERMLRAF